MNKNLLGTAVKLFVSKTEQREEKRSLMLEFDGVCEDKFKGKDIQRSVLLVPLSSYELAKKNNINLTIGELGENILIDFDPHSFESGTKLQVGNAIVEISHKSSLCPSLSKISSKLPKLLKDRRGVFAKVICDGEIHKGDSISYA